MKSFLSRLFKPIEPSGLELLWHRVIAIAREPEWYAQDGVADSVEGRFDMVTAVTALVLMRLDATGDSQAGVRLTEMFIADMDGQLRESGVGDLMVGKHMGRLVAALGGRLSAYKDGLAQDDDTALAAAVDRNMTLTETGSAAAVATRLRGLAQDLSATSDEALMSGEIAR